MNAASRGEVARIMPRRITRHQFLKAGLAASGVIGAWALAACTPTQAPAPAATLPPAATTGPAATTAPTAAPAATTAPAATSAPAAAATTAATTTGTPKQGGTLTDSATGELKFDPYWNVSGYYGNRIFFDALFDYSGPEPYKPVPHLAESYEETDKGLTIKLRQGVKFHNGREFTSQDVLDNIARAKDKSIGHYLFDTFDSSVDTAEAPDKYTVKLTYKQVYPVKLDDLAELYIIAKEAMPNVATNPVGTGPFKFDSYAPGDKLQASRFDGYWMSGKPYIDKLVTKVLPDPQALLANIQTGTIDYVGSIPLPDAARMKSEGQVNVQSTPPGGLWYAFGLNCANAALGQKQFRQAFNWATNRDQISKLAFQGLAQPTQVRYTPDQPWYDQKAASMYSFDIDKAKSLIQQSGVTTPIDIRLMTMEGRLPGTKAVAQVWAQDLQKIGVNLQITDLAQQLFVDNWNKGDYDIAIWGTGDGKLDPATQIASGSLVRTSNNRSHIETQPFYDNYKKLIDQGASTVDANVRKPVYDQIFELWNDESWQIIFAFWTEFYGLTQRVKDFHYQVDSFVSWTDVWLA